MIDDGFCVDELERLAHLRGFPQNKAAITDMIRALQVCESEASARGLVDDLVADQSAGHSCPTAGDIRRIAWERRDEETKRREVEREAWKKDKTNPVEMMKGSGFDEEFIRLYVARVKELRDPKVARFRPDESGRYFRQPTAVSRALSDVARRLSGDQP